MATLADLPAGPLLFVLDPREECQGLSRVPALPHNVLPALTGAVGFLQWPR